MAGFDLRGELLIGGEWVDATGELLKRQSLSHSRGRQDQASRVDPASLQPLLDNTDGQFSPDNPMGPYYGMFGRNTPFRLSVRAGTPVLELPGDRDSIASTPSASALNIAGDMDLRWEGEADWYATGARMILGKWGAAGQRAYHMRLQDGGLYALFTTNGTTGAFASRPLPVLPRHAALRVVFDADNGAGSSVIRFYWAETISGPWTQIGTDAVVGAVIAVPATSSPLTIAPYQDDATPVREPVAGRCYRAEVRNGIDGALVAAPDFTAQPDGTTSFTDSAGRTWTVTGSAAITNRRTRLVHELAAYPARWHPSGAHAWVEATTAGVLRRLRRGNSALQSTLRRRIPSGGPLAYWPMEDGAAATQAASALDGGRPLLVSGLEFASEGSLPSSEALPVLGESASLSGTVSGASAAGWHVEMVYKLEALPATEQTMLRVLLSPGTGGVTEVRARVSTARIKVEALDGDGAVVAWFEHTGTGRNDFIGAWNRLQLFSSVSGSQTYVTLAWRDVITGVWWYIFVPWTGTPGRLTGVRGSWGADFRGMAIGHLSAFDVGGTSATAPGVRIYEGSDEAYMGERAATRMQRLAAEESYPIAVYGPAADQERVGPQTPSPILDLLEEAADADGGILYEDRERLRLIYRGRTTLYNQRPALVLDYAEPGLAPPLEPTGDDEGVENDVTVTRVNGSSARAVLEEGPLSVQAPPDGVGPYPAQASLNLYSDEQTQPIAYWRLHLGTYEGRRYPQVRVMVHQAPPALLEQILAVDVGDRLIIRHPPRWVAPGDVELIVQGYEETWPGPFQWDIVFNCTPGEPWLVGVLDDLAYGRVDTDGSELAAGIDADDTAVSIAVTAGPLWTSSPGDMPFDVRIGGEVMTVTAPGGIPVTPNPFFETDAAGWSGASASIARVTDVVHPHPRAVASLRVTPAGGAASVDARTSVSAVGTITPGVSYTSSAWVYSPSGWADLRSIIDWHDAAGAYMSSGSSTAVVVPAGQWTYLSTTGTAPAGASRAVTRVRAGNTPSASAVYYVWSARVTPTSAGPGPQTFSVVRSRNGIVKPHAAGTPVRLAHPAIVAL